MKCRFAFLKWDWKFRNVLSSSIWQKLLITWGYLCQEKKNQIRLRLQKGVTNIATHIMLPRTCKAQVSKIERLHMSALSDRKNINWIWAKKTNAICNCMISFASFKNSCRQMHSIFFIVCEIYLFVINEIAFAYFWHSDRWPIEKKHGDSRVFWTLCLRWQFSKTMIKCTYL